MSTIGFKLLSSVVGSGSVKEFVELGLEERLFRGSEIELFNFVKGHVLSHGVLPAVDTVFEKLGNGSLVDAPEPSSFYLVEAEKRYLQSMLKKMLVDTKGFLDSQDPDKALDMVLGMVSDLKVQKYKKHIMDFRDAAEVVKNEYIKQKQMKDDYCTLFGWPTLDGMVGGARPGDFCSIVGRPASGKTFLGLFGADVTWHHGGTPLFLSMEMLLPILFQRLSAMEAHKSLTQLLKGMMSTTSFNQMLTCLKGLKKKETPFWLIDGNLAATVEDLVAFVQQLKPSAVYVDGAYLLGHPDRRMGRFERITTNAEMLKQRVATDLGVPVIASYQLSREAEKKKKSNSKHKEDVGLEDIYGTDAIGQLSTVALGLFEEDNVETLIRRRVEIMKGRNGETGAFLINWNFNQMDFSEIPSLKDSNGVLKEDTSEMKFL